MEQERRRMPRVPFVASAELLEVDTGTRMNAQVSELSLHGCYVDTLNPLPKGTSVYVKIFTEEYFFETPAIVVYAHANLGMGLAFHDVKPHFVGVLQNWVMASTAKKAHRSAREKPFIQDVPPGRVRRYSTFFLFSSERQPKRSTILRMASCSVSLLSVVCVTAL